MNIYEKLIEVRKVVPYLQKESKGYQFNYTGSSQVLGSLKAKMDELGLLLIPRVTGKEVSEHETAKGGKEYFTELSMQFIWVNAEKPEETITCEWYGQGLDNGEKGVGKAMTYAEKYFMLKFFNIATDKDDPDSFQKKMDTEPPNPKPKTQQTKPPADKPTTATHPNEAQLKRLFAISQQHNCATDAMKAWMAEYCKVESSKDLSIEQYNELCKSIEDGTVNKWWETKREDK